MYTIEDTDGKWYGSFLLDRMTEDYLKELHEMYQEQEFRVKEDTKDEV